MDLSGQAAAKATHATGSPPLSAVRGVLVNANKEAVDHLGVAVVSLSSRFENAIPDPSLTPAEETVVTGLVRALALRNVHPWRSSCQTHQYARNNLAIIRTRDTHTPVASSGAMIADS